ncbi:MAG: phosphatase PAP2 family protein [Magnetococcales bacterium]|nr:phosphatase PAP2 family protein [Magnetococcales bacterium]
MKIHNSFFPVLGLLVLTTLFFEWNSVDLWLQDFFYQPKTGQWLINRDEPIMRFILYDGAKKALVILGLMALAVFFLSFKFHGLLRFRRRAVLLSLSLIFVPAIIAGSKSQTNTYCPWDLQRYGSTKPYVKLFEPYPSEFIQDRPPKCFPAGHPTGGFALMVGFFLFSTPKGRKRGLWVGLAAGWVMGLYQMLKGAHFFSHVVFSMLAAWLVILIVVAVVDRWIVEPEGGTMV